MTREEFLGRLLGLASMSLMGCSEMAVVGPIEDGVARTDFDGPWDQRNWALQKTKAEWRALLSPAAFAILFEEGTEPAGSSPLDGEHRSGIFLCAACLIPLFSSAHKYDSKTGWPSFWDPIVGRLGFNQDLTGIEPRIEYHCARCGGHQGHVFDDGPEPTGKRYCNNGVALLFVPAGESLPLLRN